jgi:hypothetical protein
MQERAFLVNTPTVRKRPPNPMSPWPGIKHGQVFSYRLPREIDLALRSAAIARRTSFNRLLDQIIIDYLKHIDRLPPPRTLPSALPEPQPPEMKPVTPLDDDDDVF